MPYAQNKGVKIYYEVTGVGSPLVLHHGLSGFLENWKQFKYVDALKDMYRLILMDARGHGKSDKPHDPEQYSMKYMTSDVVTVLDDLNIDKAAFWGYSMGGRIGLAVAKYAPDRFTAYIIGGNGLSEKDSKEQVEELRDEIRYYRQGRDAIIASIGDELGEHRTWWRNTWLNKDLEALIAYCSFYENIGMAEYLPKLETPFLFYAGEKDTFNHFTAKECAKIMRNAEFLSLPGLNHLAAILYCSVVVPHVLRFLKKVQYM
jgi:pimeloyl-ACP methyl ester carboxylesterase